MMKQSKYQREYYLKNRDRILARTKRTSEEAHEQYMKHRDKRLAYMRDYYAKHAVKRRRKSKEWARKNKDKIKDMKSKYYERLKLVPNYFKENYLKIKYGLTLKILKKLIRLQNNRCLICGSKISIKQKAGCAIDHDHRTGIIRGILCRTCNLGLGHFKDSIDVLKYAIKYLQEGKLIMPVHKVTVKGRPAYRWGESGKAYPYTPGDKASAKRAKQKAIDQGLAVAYRTRSKPEL